MQDKDKGFWDGGTPGHGTNKESSGRPSGYPGDRKPKREGVHVDLEYPGEGREGPARAMTSQSDRRQQP